MMRFASPTRLITPRRLRRHHPHRSTLLLALAPLAAAGAFGGLVGSRWLDDARGGVADPLGAPQTLPPGGLGFAAPVGERTTDARCVMVAIDESSSMSTADTTGARADAVEAAADFLGSFGIPGDRIGVTWFADAAEVSPPVPPAQARTTRTGRVALGSGTAMSEAITQAITSLRSSCAGASPVLVLVSDGAASGDAEFAATGAALAGAPEVAVHLIAMNGDGAFESSRAFWSDPTLGIDSIETIDRFDRDLVGAAMAAILSQETGQQVAAS